ncbi:hypothetical protein PIB30_014133 [Stylosanthes scabra]|uniref:Uncharacterized protein n=1 Tax=Stylosanthes scabra TaxID=79078 RepID=A0ABU6T8L9_9FABA|nr:hypothetical protein [Stylosanthes scabra]
MDMDGIPDSLDFSEHSTTTPTSDEDCNWNHLSPLVNWESFTTDNEDFHSLIASIVEDARRGAIFTRDHGCLEEDSSADDGSVSATDDKRGSGSSSSEGEDLKDLN